MFVKDRQILISVVKFCLIEDNCNASCPYYKTDNCHRQLYMDILELMKNDTTIIALMNDRYSDAMNSNEYLRIKNDMLAEDNENMKYYLGNFNLAEELKKKDN